jgi:hypothetical protein
MTNFSVCILNWSPLNFSNLAQEQRVQLQLPEQHQGLLVGVAVVVDMHNRVDKLVQPQVLRA